MKEVGIVVIDENGRRLQEVGRKEGFVEFVVLGDNGYPLLGSDGLEETVTISKYRLVELMSGGGHSVDTVKKRVIDRYCDVLVYGQVFVDELEYLCGYKNTLFRQGLKHNALKVVNEFRGVVNTLFKNTKKRDELLKLYDVNYALMVKVNELTIDEKAQLVEVFDSVVKGLRTSYKEVTDKELKQTASEVSSPRVGN